MLASLNIYKSRVIVAIIILAACSAIQFLFLDGEGGQKNEDPFNMTAWEELAPLAGDGPISTTCSTLAEVTQNDRSAGYSRARSALQAADSLISNLREISGYLKTNSAGLQVVLPAFKALEEPLIQLRATWQSSDTELRCIDERAGDTGDDAELLGLLEALSRARRTVHSQLSEAVLAAWRARVQAEVAVSHSDRESFEDFTVFSAASIIQRFEDVATSEVEMDQSADTHFDVGLLLSDVFLITQSRTALERAEHFLRKGEDKTAEPDRRNRALIRAERMYEHAEVLATEWDFNHEVAGSRYQNAVKVAIAKQSSVVASKYLARYAHFLDAHGNLEAALSAARKASELDKNEPLARYLQVSLGRRLGHLLTDEQINLAEKHLNNIAGRLEMWPEIEDARSKLSDELDVWHQVSEAGSHDPAEVWLNRLLRIVNACRQHGDVAKITLCLLCKALLPA